MQRCIYSEMDGLNASGVTTSEPNGSPRNYKSHQVTRPGHSKLELECRLCWTFGGIGGAQRPLPFLLITIPQGHSIFLSIPWLFVSNFSLHIPSITKTEKYVCALLLSIIYARSDLVRTSVPLLPVGSEDQLGPRSPRIPGF